MPEGPEIHRQAAALRAVLAGRPATRVRFGLARLRRHARRLEGRRIEAVEARGKALLVRFEGDRWIYAHNQLYGRWTVQRGHEHPASRRSLRVVLHTATHAALLWSASDIAVLDGDDLAAHPYLARLGPDTLDPATTTRRVAARLADARFARRGLAVLLLDQSFVAGLGNYLRSEILYDAQVDPDLRPADLSSAARGRLARAILRLPRRSLRTGGVTNDASRAAALKRRRVPRDEYRFLVFGRDGRPCYACGSTIVRSERAGRRLYSCPGCQPEGAGTQESSR